MSEETQKSYPRAIYNGLILRCPNCESGRMFRGLFEIEPQCPNCAVVFERSEGESLGGAMVSLGIIELVSIAGFFISQLLFSPPLMTQVIFWATFNIIFAVVFSRHGRGMWIGVVYLTGGVYADDNSPDDSP